MLPDRVSNPGPLTYESGALPIALRSPADSGGMTKTVLKVRRGKRDILGIIFCITSLKHMF